MENQILQTIAQRASIRAYQPQPLSAAQTEALRQAALAAPTARNTQSHKLYFITNQAVKDAIEQATVAAILATADQATSERMAARGNQIIYGAPLLVVIAAEQQNPYGPIDAGIAVQTLALAAKSIGLESVILGLPSLAFRGPEGPKLAAQLGFPAGHQFMIAIAIGHGAASAQPHQGDPAMLIDIA